MSKISQSKLSKEGKMRKKIWMVSCIFLLLVPFCLHSQRRKGYFLIEQRAGPLGKSVRVMATPYYDMDIKPYILKITFLTIPTTGDMESLENRAIKVWERLNTGLDILLKKGGYLIVEEDEKGNPAIYVEAEWLKVPHRIISIFPEDVEYFGGANSQIEMAEYLKDLLYTFLTFFYGYKLPEGSPILNTRDGKIIKRLYLDAMEHAKVIRHSNSIERVDIQEAINMLSESQRERLNLLSFIIPKDYVGKEE